MNEAHPGRFELDGKSWGATTQDPEPRLPVAVVARSLRLRPATLRRYVSDHGAHLDVSRDGRSLMVAVRSVPVLTQIRDLRARRFTRVQIDRLLAALSGEAALAGLAPAPLPTDATARDGSTDKALAAMQRELATMKEALRESDVLVRQSLSNILFLVEKCGKDIQYFAAEERIASKERDLREIESEYRLFSTRGKRRPGLLSGLRARYRQVLALAFSR